MIFYTSITSCYLPKARALGWSLKKYRPDAKLYVILSDDLPEGFRISEEPFEEIIFTREIELKYVNECTEMWIYKHDVTELCTAVKGWAALKLLQKTHADKIVYLDPDMIVFNDLSELESLLDQKDVVITPHRLAPEEKFDNVFFGDHQLYMRGVFNLGFLAVKNNKNGLAFLEWWRKMLESYCYIDDPIGLFTDQKLIDLSVAFFDFVHIWRNETYNVSWWNITQRKLSGSLEDLKVNGKPLAIYHFSNYDSGLHKKVIEDYCNENKTLWELYHWYGRIQQMYGQNELGKVESVYSFYDNGERILPLARHMTRKRSDLQINFAHKNPFDAEDPEGLYQYFKSYFPDYLGADESAHSNMEDVFNYEQAYKEIQSSRAYKLSLFLSRTFNKTLPENSKRRKLAKKIYEIIKLIYCICTGKTNLARDKANWQKKHVTNLERDDDTDRITVLIIDDRVPAYDTNAGDRTTFDFLRVFTRLNYNIKYIADSFSRTEPYASILGQMGVEFIGLNGGGDQEWKEFLKMRGETLQYVYIFRPHNLQKYIKWVKKYCKAKIIYSCVDLHFLRENREQLLLKKENINDEEMRRKEIQEISLIDNADVVMTISSFEKKILEERLRRAIVVQSPIFVYDNIPIVEYDIFDRHNLIFVGGFSHTPNIDAVRWFCADILPRIKQHMPNIIIDIVGGNVPKEILNLRDANVRIHGYVSDIRLNELYKTARLSIIPLRYGAGVKGKLVEAMYHGVPVVSTSIGVEGLDGIDEFVETADQEDQFADKVVSLYNDIEKLKNMSRAGQEYVGENFSFEHACDFIKSIFK